MAAEYGVAGRHGRDVLDEMRKAERSRITLGDAYLAHHESLIRRNASKGTLSLNASQWARRLAKHQNRALSSLTRGELREWHEGWRKAGVTAANNTARMLRTILNHAIRKHDADIHIDPATAIEYFPQRNKRDLLHPSDLPAWWAAVARIENPSHRAYFKPLLFTGLRRMDAASIKLADIHEDRVHRPSPKGGTKRAFDVPMTPQLSAIIDDAKAARVMLHPRSEYLFPANSKHGHF